MTKKSRPTSKTENKLKKERALTQKRKDLLIQQLAKYPIVETACKQADIGRSTYYQWRKEDEDFERLADEALANGKLFINDMAESMLIKKIQEGVTVPLIFWLKNHHKDYNEKIFYIHENVEKELTREGRITLARSLINSQLKFLLNGEDEDIIKEAEKQQREFDERRSLGPDSEEKNPQQKGV